MEEKKSFEIDNDSLDRAAGGGFIWEKKKNSPTDNDPVEPIEPVEPEQSWAIYNEDGIFPSIKGPNLNH